MFLIEKNDFLREQLDLLKNKQLDTTIEWQDVADFRSERFGDIEHRDTVRKGSKLLYEYIDAGWVNRPSAQAPTNIVDLGSPSDKIAIQKERIKNQTVKLELNRWIRELARDELIAEEIITSINNLVPFVIPERIESKSGNKDYALCFGDAHYGIEFEIKGLFGETLNKYSPEIFEERMCSLLEKVKGIICKENITTLNVYEFSDSIDGLLRVSQIWKLRYGVVDSTIKYAEFLSTWLQELSQFVNINFQMVIDGNHSQLRLLAQPKNTFKDDNMSKVILAFVKERLKYNTNVKIIENPTGMIFDNVAGYNVLGIHGEVKNMEAALKDFTSIYKVEINYLIAAHLHHGKYEEIGMDTEVFNIPSIIGIDDYSLSLRKTSNAGAKLFCFEQGEGRGIEYNLKLQ